VAKNVAPEKMAFAPSTPAASADDAWPMPMMAAAMLGAQPRCTSATASHGIMVNKIRAAQDPTPFSTVSSRLRPRTGSELLVTNLRSLPGVSRPSSSSMRCKICAQQKHSKPKA
jgi:hypothetical protein